MPGMLQTFFGKLYPVIGNAAEQITVYVRFAFSVTNKYNAFRFHILFRLSSMQI